MFAHPLDDAQLKPFIHTLITLLATEQFDHALAELYVGTINPYGLNPNYRGTTWNADLLKQAIHNYGLFDDERPDDWEGYYHVLPVSTANQPVVDEGWWINAIDVAAGETWALDPTDYSGVVHVYLPMDYYDDPERLSDVCARFHIRRVNQTQVALELDTIHVL